MASSLRDLRKYAGYHSAREFAEAIEIPVPTYARYEQSPDKIPLRSAWIIADCLGCSIDAVVGRDEIDIQNLRGDVQKAYDALSEDSRMLANDYLEYLQLRDQKNAQKHKADEFRYFDQLARHYEQQFYDELNQDRDFADQIFFGDDAVKRDAFENYLRMRAAAQREVNDEYEEDAAERDDGIITKIMAAYERIHGSYGALRSHISETLYF